MKQCGRQPVNVAVGILMKKSGEVLLSQRPKGKVYSGYWEFPGGKVESGESIEAALKREFKEELGVTILSQKAWCCIEHIYSHEHVRLHFFISEKWAGNPKSCEGQLIQWQRAIQVKPLLPSTIPLIEWLNEYRFEME